MGDSVDLKYSTGHNVNPGEADVKKNYAMDCPREIVTVFLSAKGSNSRRRQKPRSHGFLGQAEHWMSQAKIARSVRNLSPEKGSIYGVSHLVHTFLGIVQAST